MATLIYLYKYTLIHSYLVLQVEINLNDFEIFYYLRYFIFIYNRNSPFCNEMRGENKFYRDIKF